MTYDFVVIGGGITGLTAAHTMRKMRGVIIEGKDPGGSIQTILRDGYTLERGANTFVLTQQMTKLLEELCLTDAVTPPAVYPFTQYVYYRDTYRSVPKSPLALLRTDLFTRSEKISILRGLFKRISLSGHFISVHTFMTELLGGGIAEKVLDPALRGIFGGDITRLDASAVFPKLYLHIASGRSLISSIFSGTKRKIFHLRGGNGVLIQKLQESLAQIERIHDNASSISQDTDGLFHIQTGGRVVTASRCIIATSGGATSSYIGALAPELSPLLNQIRYAPISVVHVSVPRKVTLPPKGFGVLFPSTSNAGMIGVLFNSTLFPDTAPPERHLLTVCFGGINAAQDFAEEDLSKRAVAELQQYLSIPDAHVLSVHHWERAIPQFEESFQSLQKALNLCEKNHPGIYFIGSDRGGIGVPDRIRWATDELLDRLQQPLPRV